MPKISSKKKSKTKKHDRCGRNGPIGECGLPNNVEVPKKFPYLTPTLSALTLVITLATSAAFSSCLRDPTRGTRIGLQAPNQRAMHTATTTNVAVGVCARAGRSQEIRENCPEIRENCPKFQAKIPPLQRGVLGEQIRALGGPTGVCCPACTVRGGDRASGQGGWIGGESTQRMHRAKLQSCAPASQRTVAVAPTGTSHGHGGTKHDLGTKHMHAWGHRTQSQYTFPARHSTRVWKWRQRVGVPSMHGGVPSG